MNKIEDAIHTMTDAPVDSIAHQTAKLGLEELKLRRLTDLLRRVVANPQNLNEVAEAIAADWFPLWEINAAGNGSVKLTGRRS